MPPQQLDIIEEIQLREVQAISSRIYSPTNTTSSTAMLLEECTSSKQRATKWLDDDDEHMSSSTSTLLSQPTLSRRITPDSTPAQTIPQQWPISATSTEDIKGHVRPLPFDVFSKKKRKDTAAANRQHGDKEREERPVYFYSINTMLHQQDEECWENIINDDTISTEEDSDEDMLLLGELIQDARQPTKSCLRNEEHKLSAPPKTRKRVNFSIEEISSTHSRPRTSTKDIPNLYYTEDEIYEMKCVYRTERREERRIEKVKEMEEWKKKIQRLYGDGITSYTATDDDMAVEKECNMEDDMNAQACLSWG